MGGVSQGHSVFRTCACQFFPSPSTGEGEGGGEGRWRTQAMLLPPIPPFPRQGGRGRRPRETRGKSRTEWPWSTPSLAGFRCRGSISGGRQSQGVFVRQVAGPPMAVYFGYPPGLYHTFACEAIWGMLFRCDPEGQYFTRRRIWRQ